MHWSWRSSRSAFEIAGWALIALLSVTIARNWRPMPLTGDSFQYLSAAENLEDGRGLKTSIVHFDVERSHGVIPAPLTTFAPMYPSVIALVSFRGNEESAARALGTVCYAATTAILAWALLVCGVSSTIRWFSLVLFLGNAVTLTFATSVLSDPLYMLVSMAALATLVYGEHKGSAGWVAAAHFLAGLSYWVRYAGLFLVIAMVIYAMIRAIGGRKIAIAQASISVGMALALMVRNIAVAGTWRGGNNQPVRFPVPEIVAEFVRSHVHLFLGLHKSTVGVWELLLAAGAFGIVGMLGQKLFAMGPKGEWSKTGFGFLGIFIVVYSGALMYAAVTTTINLDERMLMPMLPVYALLLGLLLSQKWKRPIVMNLCLALAEVGYVGANARDLREPAGRDLIRHLAELYAMPTASGEPLMNWVDRNNPADRAVVAEAGQETSFLLHRPTVSMVASRFSATRWECDQVTAEMQRFKADYVIVYKPAAGPDFDSLREESRFVRAAATGNPVCGFQVAAENDAVRILKIGQ